MNDEAVFGRDQEVAWRVHLTKARAAELGVELRNGCDVFVHQVDVRDMGESRSVETAYAAI